MGNHLFKFCEYFGYNSTIIIEEHRVSNIVTLNPSNEKHSQSINNEFKSILQLFENKYGKLNYNLVIDGYTKNLCCDACFIPGENIIRLDVSFFNLDIELQKLILAHEISHAYQHKENTFTGFIKQFYGIVPYLFGFGITNMLVHLVSRMILNRILFDNAISDHFKIVPCLTFLLSLPLGIMSFGLVILSPYCCRLHEFDADLRACQIVGSSSTLIQYWLSFKDTRISFRNILGPHPLPISRAYFLQKSLSM